jgi:hypothetical protein
MKQYPTWFEFKCPLLRSNEVILGVRYCCSQKYVMWGVDLYVFGVSEFKFKVETCRKIFKTNFDILRVLETSKNGNNYCK